LIVAPWLLAQRRWRELLRLLHPLGLLAFAILALPWFVAMQQRYAGFFDYFIVEQHFRRFALMTFNNVRPAWFFVVMLPLVTLPWSAWLPLAWRERAAMPPARLALYLWWVVVVVGFFSLPSSKLIGYVLPALAPWCLLLSLGVARHPRGLRVTLALSALASLALVAALAWKAPHSSRPAATVLAAQMSPGDRVVFVDHMFYDLPFYAGLTQPPIVASDWADPLLPQHDNWRKELYDAGRFDIERARELLWPIERLAELTCHSHAVWFVLKPSDAARVAALPGATTVHVDADALLVHASGRRCS